MTTVVVVFWGVMIFACIAWYNLLIFNLGIQGRREIEGLTRAFDRRDEERNE